MIIKIRLSIKLLEKENEITQDEYSRALERNTNKAKIITKINSPKLWSHVILTHQ